MTGNVPSTINLTVIIHHIDMPSNISLAFLLYRANQTYLGGVLQFRLSF